MNNLWDLTGKTALVVGYGGQLGPIWMETLEQAGAEVYGLGLPNCDVTLLEEVEKFKHIEPDIIIYNAAIDNPPDANEPDGHDMFRNFEKITSVNQFGAVNVLRTYLHGMIRRGGGSVHFIGSIMGYGPPDESNYPDTKSGVWTKPLAYGASKRAYLNFAQWLTKKFGKNGIRASVAAFGPIDLGKLPPEFMAKITDKIPTGKFTSIDDLKRTMLYNVCCENFAGQDTLVDGGYRER